MTAAAVSPTREEIEAQWNWVREVMAKANHYLFERHGFNVLTGPFTGMLVPENPPWNDGNAGLKLIGCYEHELHAAIEKAIARNPYMIVNVGCAEGYYAVGLARRLPRACVCALDVVARSLDACLENAERNGVVDRVFAKLGAWNASEIAPRIQGHCLFVMDCEGEERVLLDPVGCPQLVKADIIVECHDFLDADISARIMSAFEATHDIERIEAGQSPIDQHEALFGPDVPRDAKVFALTEKRPEATVWLAMWAKAHLSTKEHSDG